MTDTERALLTAARVAIDELGRWADEHQRAPLCRGGIKSAFKAWRLAKETLAHAVRWTDADDPETCTAEVYAAVVDLAEALGACEHALRFGSAAPVAVAAEAALAMDRATLLHLTASLAANGTPAITAYQMRATRTRMRSFDLRGARFTVDTDHDNDAALGETAEVMASLPALVTDLAAELAAARAELAKMREVFPPAPPLRARRWRDSQWSGHRLVSRAIPAGCDCPVCNLACEPVSGWGYRCPKCGLKGEACGSTYGGTKACELPHGHDGDHESPSGFSWRQDDAHPARTKGAD